MVAKSIALREELLVNHHVGSLRELDVWNRLANWDIEVGHVAILSTKNAEHPWLVGDVLEVLNPDEASARLSGSGKADHMIVIHERGYEKPHSAEERKRFQDTSVVNMYSPVSFRDWKFDGKNLWRFQKQTANGLKEDFYINTATTKQKNFKEVRFMHSRETVAFWGPAASVLKGASSGYQVLQKVLGYLSANPNVLWKQPAPQRKKRKRSSDSD